jgi:DNA-binding response OmpR family regulator
MRKKKILIIDHEPSGRQALRSILQPNNFELMEAADGPSGWLTFEKEQPELVILDIQLPQGQGFDLCQKIILASRLDRIPIVVVTDFGLESDAMLRKLSSVDVDFIFPKPVPAKELVQTVNSLLGMLPDAAPAPLPQAGIESQDPIPDIEPTPAEEASQDVLQPPDEAPPTLVAPAEAPAQESAQESLPPPAPVHDVFEILPLQTEAPKAGIHRLVLADDNPVTRQIIQRAFSPDDYEITILTDGREALDSMEKIRPDVILLDINLPGKDGYELCEEIRNSRALKGTALIILKEQYEKVDQQKLQGLSWDDFIQKPIKSLEWIAKVKNILAKKS